jgi:hypothetical protein
MFSSFDRHATGMPVLDAQADFRRARRAHAVARLGRWLNRRAARPSTPRTLAGADALLGGTTRLQVVALDTIVGTLDPTVHFDARFRPASELVRARWERVALAHRRGIALPPIHLRLRSDGHYVVDGRHRVSVAIALGHRDIDAWVTSDGVSVQTSAPARPQPGRRSAKRPSMIGDELLEPDCVAAG